MVGLLCRVKSQGSCEYFMQSLVPTIWSSFSVFLFVCNFISPSQ